MAQKTNLTTPQRPIGLFKILNWMEKNGHEGNIYDIRNLKPSEEEMIEHFKKIKPDVVGFSAVLAALAAGASKVLALDLSKEKLEFADGLGVHHTVNAGHHNVVETIDALTDGGVHVAIETAGSPHALQTAYDMYQQREDEVIKIMMQA